MVVTAPRPQAVALLPTEPGVYRFRDDRGRVLYIGRAGSLRARVSSYWGRLPDRRHLRRMVPQIVRIEALVCASEHEAAWVERMLLEHRMPRWNRAVGGMENPVLVRLDVRAPSLTVAHEKVEAVGVRWYGPYLGGTATRLAVSALQRVHPLTYARDRLTGTERDLARIHGVDRIEPAALVAAVDAVLSRDPVAVTTVRTSLEARRDDASGKELYEVAAAIQAEIEAVDWLTSPVRLVGTPDLDLAAATDGVRVSLTFRGGRLRTWDQGPDDAPTSPPRPEWHDFLSRNASLAAALAAHPVR